MAIRFLSGETIDGNVTINGGQILTPSGVNLALNPNTGVVAVGGVIQASGTGNNTFSGDVTLAATKRLIFADDKIKIGSNSTPGAQGIQVGYAATASGDQAIAFGYDSNATGNQSIAMGYNSTASGTYSQAYGYNVDATGTGTVVFGTSGSHSDANTFVASGLDLKVTGTGTSTFTGAIATSGNITTTASNATISAAESGGATTKIMGASVGRVGTSSNHNLEILSNNTAAITIDTSQNATFAGDITVSGTITLGTASFVGTVAGATVVSSTGAYASSGSVKLYEAKRSGGAVGGDWSYDDATTDMSLGTNTNHAFNLKTNNLDRISIANGGNVGIGITSPAAILDIGRNATKTNTGTSEIMYIGTSNEASNYATLQVYTEGAAAAADRKWMFQTIEQGVANAGNISFQPSGGNVGIGTKTPAANLQVESASATTIAISNSSSVTSGNRGDLAWYNSAVSTVAIIRAGADTDNVGTNLQFHTRPVGGAVTETMRIDSSGNLSLATATALDFQVADFAQIKFRESGAITIDSDNDQSSRNFQFKDGSGSSLMFIGDDGNVGIGTTSPSTPLMVNRASNSNEPGIYYDVTGGGSGSVGIGSTAAVGPFIAGNTLPNGNVRGAYSASRMLFNGGGFSFQTSDETSGARTWDDRMKIEIGGNVGIGTTSPDTLLNLEGAVNTSIITLGCTKNDASWSGERIGGINFYSADGSGPGASVRGSINYIATSSSGGDTAMTFATGDNTERMRIDNDGAVTLKPNGITTGLRLQGRSSDNNFYIQFKSNNGNTTYSAIGSDSSNTALLYQSDTHKFQNTASNNTYMTIDSSGNVGIGITSPHTTLEVDGADSALNAHVGQGQNNSSGVWGGISLGYAETSNASYRKVGIVAKALGDGAARQDLHFLVDTANDSNSATISDSKMMIEGLTGNVGVGTSGPVGVVGSGSQGNTTLHVEGPLYNKRIMRGWYICGPITSTDSYRHIKTNLWMGGSPAGNTEYIMGGFEVKGYAYYGSYPGFGHGTCMFHNWSGSFASLSVLNFAQSGFVQNPYTSSDGYCVIVLRQNTYMQPVIDFCQYYTPYPWRSSYVTAETTSNNLTGVY